jgi:DNA modification methylase
VIEDVLAGRATWAIEQGHVMDLLRATPSESVHCVVTSPPYWNLRSYLDPGHSAKSQELGSEPTLGQFVANIVEVMREVWRVLRSDGVLWLNIGDSYSGAGYSNHTGTGGALRSQGGKQQHTHVDELGEKQLLMIPARVAIALQEDGWILRSDVVWSKPNPMPEPVEDRPSKAHEYVFLFSKQERYFYDADAIRTQLQPKTLTTFGTRHNPLGTDDVRKVKQDNWARSVEFRKPKLNTSGELAGANIRSVWEIATQPVNWEFCLACGRFYLGKERKAIRVVKTTDAAGLEHKTLYCQCGSSDAWVDHYAAFPPELARRCITAGTSQQGVCADCGAPWQRVVERSGGAWPERKAAGETTRHGQAPAPAEVAPRAIEHKTIGWRPTCTCEAPIAPAVVLDPFVGSGTSVVVARRLGRHGVGFDLNARYVELARRRVVSDQPLFNTVVALEVPQPAQQVPLALEGVA